MADRILKAQELDIERLLNCAKLRGKASRATIAESRVAVPIVSEIAAINAPFAPTSTEIAMLPLPSSALRFVPAPGQKAPQLGTLRRHPHSPATSIRHGAIDSA